MAKEPLSAEERKNLIATLSYFTLEELNEVCKTHKLSLTGSKQELINRITHFATSLQKTSFKRLPEASLAKKGRSYPLHKETLILKGSYKTNAATRKFMEKLSGARFNFSAASQEWIASLWRKGTPPTYNDLALYWRQEETRKAHANKQKDYNWAYESFMKSFRAKHPEADEQACENAWQKLRDKMKKKALDLLSRALSL